MSSLTPPRSLRLAAIAAALVAAAPTLAWGQGRALPVLGAVRIDGAVDPAHPYTSRGALRTRSRPEATFSSLDLPSLANASLTARNLLLAARGFMGTPYVWGGTSPGGFDCSGFTKYVFARHGVTLPRTSREQSRAGDGVPLDFDAFLPGDILLFAEPGEAISHVAIYVGSGRIIHASSAMGGVNYLDLDGDRGAWYVQNLVSVRRLL